MCVTNYDVFADCGCPKNTVIGCNLQAVVNYSPPNCLQHTYLSDWMAGRCKLQKGSGEDTRQAAHCRAVQVTGLRGDGGITVTQHSGSDQAQPKHPQLSILDMEQWEQNGRCSGGE